MVDYETILRLLKIVFVNSWIVKNIDMISGAYETLEFYSKHHQVLVNGTNVSKEQAEDIIFRTDYFLTNILCRGGNNFELNSWYATLSGLEVLSKMVFDKHDLVESTIIFEKLQERIDGELGIIHCNILGNDVTSSPYIFEEHGWCDYDGRIYFIDDVDIGNYKSNAFNTFLKDIEAIASAFPYLNMYITIMDGESINDDDEIPEPMVSFKVHEGSVSVLKGNLKYHGGKVVNRNMLSNYGEDLYDKPPIEVLEKFALKVRKTLDKILKDIDSDFRKLLVE